MVQGSVGGLHVTEKTSFIIQRALGHFLVAQGDEGIPVYPRLSWVPKVSCRGNSSAMGP